MLPEFRRDSLTGAFEKAKSVISLSRQSSSLSFQQQQAEPLPTTDENDYIEEDQQQQQQQHDQQQQPSSSTGNNKKAAAVLFSEFRSTSTRAFEKAKLVVLNRGQSSLSDTNSEMGGTKDSGSDASSSKLDELAQYCPKLTWQQRLIGFGISFSLGYLIAFFSFTFFVDLVEGDPLPFALNYTFGHILQLLASTFLSGPRSQFKKMFDEKRRYTSIIYLSCLVLSLLFVFIPMPSTIKLIVLLITMMIQFCASCWYSLSYIPFGRRTAIKIMKKILGIQDENSNNNAYYIGIQLPGRASSNGVMA